MTGNNYDMILPIKGKWYKMIESGVKLEEYREMKPYYAVRIAKILGYFEMYKEESKEKCIKIMEHDLAGEDSREVRVLFRNGYGSSCPSFVKRCAIRIKSGNSNWGAEPGVLYYVFKIL